MAYHKILSPSLVIPTDPTVPVPVGLLACQRDPLLQNLETCVVSCVPHVADVPDANKRKKAPSGKGSDKTALFDVILQDTVLFPEGGGQPFDIGTLQAEDGTCVDVIQVIRRGGVAVHVVQILNNTNPFPVGSQVKVALGEKGYDRRLDHMSMHTSQHLLSALLETKLNLPTLSWSLTAYPSPSYVELPRAVTSEEIKLIQEEANRLVYEGRKVSVEVDHLVRDREAPVPTIENGRSVGKALPEDYTGGVKRVVIIDGVDRNPCCGTHMPSLHNLQMFLLPQTESLSRSSVTTSRLFFLCGPRLLQHLGSYHNLLTQTSNILSSGPAQVPDRVTQVVEERKRAEKRVEELEYELSRRIAGELLLEGSRNQDQALVKHLHRTDDSVNPLLFLQAISSAFISEAAANSMKGYFLVLTSSPTSQSSNSTTTVMVLTLGDSATKAIGPALKEKLGVKGGGKGTRWSGKWTGVWKDREGIVIDEILNTYRG